MIIRREYFMERYGIQPVLVDDSIAECRFNRDYVVEAEIPICVPKKVKVLKLIGENPNGQYKIKLLCQNQVQPCIGHETWDGMSYGRWSPADENLEELIIENLDVICIGYAEQPFTLGSYGRNQVPEITLNNAKFYCPEILGKRIVTKWATPPEGSSKISERMEYMIIPEGRQAKDYLDPERKAIIDEIAKYRRDIYERADVRHTKQVLENLLWCVKCDDSIDFDYWLEKHGNATYWMTLKTAATLLMPLSAASNIEFLFECEKIEFLRENYTSVDKDMNYNAGELVACIIQFLINRDGFAIEEIDDFSWEFYYEMIPSYFHTFNSKERTHKDEVILFLEENPLKDKWMKYCS